MEYIPYVIGTSLFGGSLSFFVGNIYTKDSNELEISEELNVEISEEKELNDSVDIKSYDVLCNNNKYLGKTFNEKSVAITNICIKECNLKMRVYSKKKHYNKLRKYIYEYEKEGHDSFVKNHYQILAGTI